MSTRPFHVVRNDPGANTSTATATASLVTDYNWSISEAAFMMTPRVQPDFSAAKPVHLTTSPKMSDQDLTDAKLAAVEARTDTKIAKLEGKIDLVLSKLETAHKDAEKVQATSWRAAATVIAVLGLLVTFGQWMFGYGAQMRDMVKAEVSAQTHASSTATRAEPAQTPPQR